MPDVDGGLETRDLMVNIGDARVVSSVNLVVGPGEIVGLAGRNGAGKTTTLRAISGVLPRSGGEVLYNDVRLPRRPELVARMGVVHVPEGRGLFASLSVEDNVRVGAVGRGRGASEDMIDGAIAAFPVLDAVRKRKAGSLSGGQQQMVALARGLAAEPRVLLIDEMSLGLAPRAVNDAMDIIVGVARNREVGLLVVDQNAALLAERCDRLYLLDEGRTHEWDRVSDIVASYF